LIESGKTYIYKDPTEEHRGVPRFYQPNKGRYIVEGDLVKITKVVEVRTKFFGTTGRPVIDYKFAIEGCCNSCAYGIAHHQLSVEEGKEFPFFEEVEEVVEEKVDIVDVILLIMEMTEFTVPSHANDFQSRELHVGTTKYTVSMKSGCPSSLLIGRKNERGHETARIFSPTDMVPKELVVPLSMLYDSRKETLQKAQQVINRTTELLKQVKDIENGAPKEVPQASTVN
jgi:hypothetical protein